MFSWPMIDLQQYNFQWSVMKQKVLGRANCKFYFHTTRTTYKTTYPKLCYFFVSILRNETVFLPSRCLAMIGGKHIQAKRLQRGIYEVRRSDWFRCCDVIKNVIHIGSGIHIHKCLDFMCLLLYFQTNESRPVNCIGLETSDILLTLGRACIERPVCA